jgi:hypothetical protein
MDSSVSLSAKPTAATSANISRTNIRKKPSSKQDESEKITEKMEGGIIVRRYKGRKIEIEP